MLPMVFFHWKRSSRVRPSTMQPPGARLHIRQQLHQVGTHAIGPVFPGILREQGDHVQVQAARGGIAAKEGVSPRRIPGHPKEATTTPVNQQRKILKYQY
jgi:hypothetical protein